jgi:hypothetical protein
MKNFISFRPGLKFVTTMFVVGLLSSCASSDPLTKLIQLYNRDDTMVCIDNEFCLGRLEMRDGIERLTSINNAEKRFYFTHAISPDQDSYSINVNLQSGQVEKVYVLGTEKESFFYDYINYVVIYGDESELDSIWENLRLVEYELTLINSSLLQMYEYYN